jgi:hypothetical protein
MAASPQASGHPAPPTTDKAVLALSLIAFLGCCAGWLWLAIGSDGTGWDFTGFYLAGQVPFSALYDQAVFQETGRQLLAPIGIDYYPPYVRPAVFSVPLRLFTWLPYWSAYWVFAALQFLFYVAAIYLLWRQFRFPVELVVGFGFFYPGMMSIVTGHDPNVEALLMAVGLLLLLNKKPATAGLVLALALYKFNLVFLIPLMLLIKKQYRALGYMAGGGAALALASALLVSPTAYLELLPNIPKYTAGYEPAKTMIGFRSLSYWIEAPELYYPLAFAGIVFCLFAIWKSPLTEAYCIALAGSMLCGFHIAWYDGVCLMVPMTVVLARNSKPAALISALLLFLFPVWPVWPAAISILLLLLVATIGRPWEWALRRNPAATTAGSGA